MKDWLIDGALVIVASACAALVVGGVLTVAVNETASLAGIVFGGAALWYSGPMAIDVLRGMPRR